MNVNKIEAFNTEAVEQIERVFDLPIDAPIGDFKDFMRYNQHFQDEFRYLYGFLHGVKEALDVNHDEMDKRVNGIIDLLGDWL